MSQLNKKAPPGQKLRRMVGGADSVTTVAAVNAVRAIRDCMVKHATIEGVPVETAFIDDLALGVMFDHMEAHCDMNAPSPKGHWEKMKRYLKKEWEPPSIEVVTADPNEDFDAWLEEVDGTMPVDPMERFKKEGSKWAKEYARKGQQGQKFFIKKVELEGEPYLVVGSSSGEIEGELCHANGAVGNTSFKDCDKHHAVLDERGGLLKVYCKDYKERTYWVQFLQHVPEREFRLWWNIDGTDKIKHYLVMDDESEHGFRKHPTRRFKKAA